MTRRRSARATHRSAQRAHPERSRPRRPRCSLRWWWRAGSCAGRAAELVAILAGEPLRPTFVKGHAERMERPWARGGRRLRAAHLEHLAEMTVQRVVAALQ